MTLADNLIEKTAKFNNCMNTKYIPINADAAIVCESEIEY
jgi:hypothetical protein